MALLPARGFVDDLNVKFSEVPGFADAADEAARRAAGGFDAAGTSASDAADEIKKLNEEYAKWSGGGFMLPGAPGDPGAIEDYLNEVEGTTTGIPLYNQPHGGLLPPTPDKGKGSKGSASGGGSAASDGFEQRLEQLTEQFQTERELVDQWYEESMEILDDRRAMEILGAEGHAEALLAIEEEKAARIAEIDAAAYQRRMSDAANLFGQLANIASVGGKKSAVAVATFQAIEIGRASCRERV